MLAIVEKELLTKLDPSLYTVLRGALKSVSDSKSDSNCNLYTVIISQEALDLAKEMEKSGQSNKKC